MPADLGQRVAAARGELVAAQRRATAALERLADAVVADSQTEADVSMRLYRLQTEIELGLKHLAAAATDAGKLATLLGR
jgi:hypothetical protein